MPKIKKPTLPLNYKAALLKIIYLLCSELLQFPPHLFLNHNILQHWGSRGYIPANLVLGDQNTTFPLLSALP